MKREKECCSVGFIPEISPTALSKPLGQPVQSPSIHLQEKKVVMAEGVSAEVCAKFKERTEFDV